MFTPTTLLTTNVPAIQCTETKLQSQTSKPFFHRTIHNMYHTSKIHPSPPIHSPPPQLYSRAYPLILRVLPFLFASLRLSVFTFAFTRSLLQVADTATSSTTTSNSSSAFLLSKTVPLCFTSVAFLVRLLEAIFRMSFHRTVLEMRTLSLEAR